MNKPFWDGFWFGLNPLNSFAVLRNLWHELRVKSRHPRSPNDR